MPRTGILCAIYFIIALVALVSCWTQNWHYVPDGALGGTMRFMTDAWVTPASRSLALDISFIFLGASIWMIVEARRLRIRHVWAYIVFGLLIAISVTFPLFLIARERSLSRQPERR